MQLTHFYVFLNYLLYDFKHFCENDFDLVKNFLDNFRMKSTSFAAITSPLRKRAWTKIEYYTRICQYQKDHNTLCLSLQNFAEALFPVSPRQNKNKAYANFGGTNKKYYGILDIGLFQITMKKED